MSDKTFITILILVFVIPGLIFSIFVLSASPWGRFRNRPEQFEQVEVVDKRVEQSYGGGGKYSGSHVFRYIVAFKFIDGSVKEMRIDVHSTKTKKQEVSCDLYDALKEGDTGTITYKEVENVEEKYGYTEDVYYDGRLFISFEKDPEYGGLKILAGDKRLRPDQRVTVGSFALTLIILIILLVFDVRRNKISNKQRRKRNKKRNKKRGI